MKPGPKVVPDSECSKILAASEINHPVTLNLPKAHKDQLRFINAFDAKKNPVTGDIIYDDREIALHPDWPLAYPELRFLVGACGSKWGKTMGCCVKIVKEAWRNLDYITNRPLDHAGLYWWVAPSYKQAKNAFKQVKKMLPKGYFKEYKSNSEIKITLLRPDGTEHAIIDFRSADNYDGLRGEEVSFFIFDEAARGVNYEAFVSVMTTLSRTMGKGIFISTPNGRNWFYDIYKRGEKHTLLPGEIDEWISWLSVCLPTWNNPYIKAEAIRDMKQNLPQSMYEQEICARFMQNSAGVFERIDECVKGPLDARGNPIWEMPIPGRRYVMGVDLAKKRDYTVIIVMDATTNHVVYFDRFNKTDWTSQKRRIMQIALQYNRAKVCMDATGLGDVVHDDLRNAGLNTEPYVLSVQSKQVLIDKLRIAIEFQRITFPQISVMIKELRDYELTITINGKYTYSAPQGFHDDTVIALALVWWIAERKPFKYRGKSRRGI